MKHVGAWSHTLKPLLDAVVIPKNFSTEDFHPISSDLFRSLRSTLPTSHDRLKEKEPSSFSLTHVKKKFKKQRSRTKSALAPPVFTEETLALAVRLTKFVRDKHS